MDFGGTISWNGVRRLLWDDLEVGSASYHASLFAAEGVPNFRIAAHRHDFFEMMLILEGEGYHPIDPYRGIPRTERLIAGDLVFLRPEDAHAIAIPVGSRLHWINIAFPAAAWETFRIAADLARDEWDTATLPLSVHLIHRESQTACTGLFRSALQRFQVGRAASDRDTPDRLELCGFLASAVRFLRRGDAEPEGQLGSRDYPPWLTRACRLLQREIDQESGDPASIDAAHFATLAGVSPSHLARTLKAVVGRTPTEYVNDLRLTRAALLLTTTACPILDITADCGFGQLSYFYRLFRRRFGMPPDAYRRAALGPLTL